MSELKFSKITKIETADKQKIYHITVKNNHNFFGNKLCLHNCGYRGEIKVLLVNLSLQDFTIKSGDRIAQGVITPVQSRHTTLFRRVNELDSSERGTGGFGSTGV